MLVFKLYACLYENVGSPGTEVIDSWESPSPALGRLHTFAHHSQTHSHMGDCFVCSVDVAGEEHPEVKDVLPVTGPPL